MGSEFEPDVRTEETPEARIVIVDLQGFGFRREDLRVQINNRGNLVMRGERRGKEIEETTKIFDQQNQTVQDERSNPVEQEEDSMPETDVIPPDNHKAEASASAKESLELLEEEKQEMLEGLAGEPPTSTQTSAVSAEPGSPHQSEAIQAKSKQEKEVEKGQTSSAQENNIESSVDDGKPDEKNHLVVAEEGNEDGTGIVYGLVHHSQ